MTIRVRLFARACDLVGVDEIEVEVAAGATVGDVRRALAPTLGELLGCCAVAVDEDFAGDDVIVTDASEIAVIPPISGGGR